MSAQKLYRSTVGSLDINQTLEIITADLHSLIAKVSQSFCITDEVGPLSEAEQEDQDRFHAICDEAKSIAEEFVGTLRDVKS